MTSPRRLLSAFAPQRGPVINRGIEPLLGFEHLPPPEPSAPQPLARRAVELELELEEGSRRFYQPMQEEVVLERPRRR